MNKPKAIGTKAETEVARYLGRVTTIPEPGATARRKRRPKDIGTDAERGVERYLQTHGFTGAEKRRPRGKKDAGDITGCPGVCVEVKGGDAAKDASDLLIADWLEETEKERVHARADVGVLVLQRRGAGPANAGRWWAVMTLPTLLSLTTLPRDYLHPAIPLRMLLADAVRLLREAGYGDPPDTEVPDGD